MGKKQNPNPARAEIDGMLYRLGRNGYEVEIPHPFGRSRSYERFQTGTRDFAQAQQLAGAQRALELELVALVDEREVQRRLKARNDMLAPLLPQVGFKQFPDGTEYHELPSAETVWKEVVDKWWATIESFGIDPFSTVQVVPVDFSPELKKLDRYHDLRALAYWMSRKKASTMDPQKVFAKAIPHGYHDYDAQQFGELLATSDEESSWGYGQKLKGVIETVNLLARARTDCEQLARIFLRASIHDVRVRFRVEALDQSGRRQASPAQYVAGYDVLSLAGLAGNGPWHSASKQTQPDIMVQSENRRQRFQTEDHRTDQREGYRRIEVESLLELVELLAVEHARVIGQYVVILFVDRANPDPKLGTVDKDLDYNDPDDDSDEDEVEPQPDQKPDEQFMRSIRADLFDALQRSPAMQAKVRGRLRATQVVTKPAIIRVPIVPPTRKAVEPEREPKKAPRPPILRPRVSVVETVQPMSKNYSYLDKLKQRKAEEAARKESLE